MNIQWIGSPNFDSNKLPTNTIVIHWMAGNLKSTDAQFQKAGGTSAHFGVEDETIHQYVLEDKVAYHAGNYEVNQRSIGIEHSAQPGRPASDATYQTSGALIGELCQKYAIPLTRDHIVPHNSITSTQCPGTMDIGRLIQEAEKHLIQSLPANQPMPESQPYKRSDDDNKYIKQMETAINLKDIQLDKDIKQIEDLNSEKEHLADLLKECQNKPPTTIVVEKKVPVEVVKIEYREYEFTGWRRDLYDWLKKVQVKTKK